MNDKLILGLRSALSTFTISVCLHGPGLAQESQLIPAVEETTQKRPAVKPIKEKKRPAEEGYYSSFGSQPTSGSKQDSSAGGYYANIPAVTDSVATESASPANIETRSVLAAPTPSPVVPIVKSVQSSVAKPTMSTAVKAFNDRRFGDALTQFDKLDKSGQCNDKVHYFMGRCLQQMAQIRPAQANYEWVLKYSKDARLRSYAETAYEQLSYYAQHREYNGQGNYFQGFSGSG